MAVTLPPKGLSGNIISSNMVSASLSIPSRIVPNSVTISGDGGAFGSGVANVTTRVGTIVVSGSGGALGSGTAGLIYGGNLIFVASGGALGSGTAPYARSKQHVATGGALGSGDALVTEIHPSVLDWTPTTVAFALGAGSSPAVFIRPHIAATLPLISASLAMPNPFDHIYGRMKLMTSSIDALIGGQITAELSLLAASLSVWENAEAQIDADLPLLGSALTGGEYSITASLPLLSAAVTGIQGEAGTIDTSLPTLTSAVSALVGTTGVIGAQLVASGASLSATAGSAAAIVAALPNLDGRLTAYAGTAGSITAELGTIEAALTAGFGATGTITANLPLVGAALSVLANAAAQQLVMVVNTQTDAVSTYENFPFNSFCEIGGVYYGASASGVSQIDVGDTDAGTSIAAGLSTGLLDFKESHLKRVIDAYMTLRTTGGLTLATTVDEAARYSTVRTTMVPQGTAALMQRRVPMSKGLQGKLWQFELHNVAGADFDFGHLGVNVAPSARRVYSVA